MGKTKQPITVSRNWVTDELTYDHTTRTGKTTTKKLSLKPGQKITIVWSDGTFTSGTVELEPLYEINQQLWGPAPHARDVWTVRTNVKGTDVKVDVVGLTIIV